MNLETVEQVVSLLNEYPVSEITLEQDGGRVYARRGHSPLPAAAVAPTPAANTEISIDNTAAGGDDREPITEADETPILLAAPMVGLFHHLDPPIRYGGLLASGDVVGSIESMKLMNDVTAEQGGRIIEVLVEDGAPVEYGQALFRLASG